MKHHERALELLGRPLPVSADATRTLDRLEREHGFNYPAAMRAWYELSHAAELLAVAGHHAHLALPDLWPGVDDKWCDGVCRDDGVVWLVFGGQSTWRWGVRLDGSDDPEVVVQFEDDPATERVVERFSDFVVARLFDIRLWKWWYELRGDPMEEADYAVLSRLARRHPTSRRPDPELAPVVHHRFAFPSGRLTVTPLERDTFWELTAPEKEDVVALADELKGAAGLRCTFRAFELRERIVERLPPGLS